MTNGNPNTAGHTRRWSMMLALLTLAMVSLGATCRSTNTDGRIIVPAEDTAREQFGVAEYQYQQALGMFDRKLREVEMRKAIAAYQEVERRFPQDEKYTPPSALIVGTIYRDLEEWEKAATQYRHVLRAYPNDEAVRISALMGLALSLNETDKQEEALVYFKQVLDEYGSSTDPRVQEIVEEARRRYRTVRLVER